MAALAALVDELARVGFDPAVGEDAEGVTVAFTRCPFAELAEANPERTFWLVGDSAYINAAVLQGRPANLQVIGPLHWKAALYDRPAPPQPKRKGAPRKKGDRLEWH